MRPSYALLLSACFCALPLQASEKNWPQFRGPTGQGISLAENVPTTWSATENIRWKVAVPGSGWSSPAILDEKLYLTAAIPEAGSSDVRLHALCFDTKDGKLLWNTEVLKPDPASVAAMHSKNSPASPTPIVEGGKVYVHFGHMGTAALDLKGTVLWRQTELGYSPTHGGGGSPILLGDALIFSADGDPEPMVIALEAATGKLRWKTPRKTTARKHFSFSTPLAITVEGKPQVVSPGSGFVAAYDPSSGREYWRVRYGEGYSVVPRPIFSQGLLLLSSGYDSAWVYAVRPAGAAGDATDSHVAWKSRKGAPNTPSIIASGNEIYYVSDGGIATCADVRTGTPYWTERLGGDFSASPVLAEGRIYFQSETGIGYVVKADKSFQLLSKNELGERTLSSPAIVDGAIYQRSAENLWRIGK